MSLFCNQTIKNKILVVDLDKSRLDCRYEFNIYCNNQFISKLHPDLEGRIRYKLKKKGVYYVQERFNEDDSDLKITNYDQVYYIPLFCDYSEHAENICESYISLRKKIDSAHLVNSKSYALVNIFDVIDDFCLKPVDFMSNLKNQDDSEYNKFKSIIESFIDHLTHTYKKDRIFVYLKRSSDKVKNWYAEEAMAILDSLNYNTFDLLLMPENILKLELEKIAKAELIPLPEIQSMQIFLKNNLLSFNAKVRGKKCTARIDLMKDDKIIDKSFSTIYKKKWTLTETGIYFVIIHFSIYGYGTYKVSNCVWYATEDFNKDYNSFMQRDFEKYQVLPVRNSSEPYLDFVTITSKTDYSKYDFGLPCTFDSKTNTYIFTDLKQKNNLFISGITYGGSSIVGDYSKPCGTYSFIHLCSEYILISKDPFNGCPIYYYADEADFVTSNCYHRLLTTLKKIGKELVLDDDKLNVTLSIPHTELFRNNYSYQMDVKNIHVLPISRDIKISEGKASLIKNEIGFILESDKVFHIDQYVSLLNNAADEIVDTIKNISDDYPICSDLTAGIDSRIVYAGVCKASRDVLIRTSTSSEAKYALSLMKIGKHKLLDMPNEYVSMSVEDGDMWLRSQCLGTNFEHRLDAMYRSPVRYYNLTGTYGEGLTRSEYIVHCNNLLKIESNEKTLSESYINKFSHNIIVDQTYSGNIVDLIRQQLQMTECINCYEKFETNFLEMYEHSHGDVVIANQRNALLIMPIQSISLFKIHHLVLNYNHTMKLAFDLLALLDKRLFSVPYNHESYHKELDNIKNSLLYHTDIDFSLIDENIDEWISTECSRPRTDSKYKGVELKQFYSEKTLLRLHQLLKSDGAIEQNVGKSLYHHITSTDIDQYEYNKITSVLDQIMILQG